MNQEQINYRELIMDPIFQSMDLFNQVNKIAHSDAKPLTEKQKESLSDLSHASYSNMVDDNQAFLLRFAEIARSGKAKPDPFMVFQAIVNAHIASLVSTAAIIIRSEVSVINPSTFAKYLESRVESAVESIQRCFSDEDPRELYERAINATEQLSTLELVRLSDTLQDIINRTDEDLEEDTRERLLHILSKINQERGRRN